MLSRSATDEEFLHSLANFYSGLVTLYPDAVTPYDEEGEYVSGELLEFENGEGPGEGELIGEEYILELF